MGNFSKESPIGIFDSGVGGLTVANAISELLPSEQIIYFGDTQNLPYGSKSRESIIEYAKGITEFLISKGCKAIVIACNSASSAAFEIIDQLYAKDAFIINVIDPVIDAVVQMDTIESVGIIGTNATINSNAYQERLANKRPKLPVYAKATPLLAKMIEVGFINNKISQDVIEEYLKDTEFKDIDAMILACTHYPLIKREIQAFLGHQVDIYDSTLLVAGAIREKLANVNLLNNAEKPKHYFYVSDYTDAFEKTTRYFYKEKITFEYYPLWDK